MVKDLPRSSRPSTYSTDETIDKGKEMVMGNRHLNLREMAQSLDESIYIILVDL